MNINVLFPLINNMCAVCISLVFQHQRLPAASLSPSTFSKDRSPHAERQALLTCLHTLKGWGGYHQISQFTLEYLGILAILGIMGEVVNSKENGSMQHDVSIYYRYTIWYTLPKDIPYILLLWCRMVLGFAKRQWLQVTEIIDRFGAKKHILEAPKTWIRGKGKKRFWVYIFLFIGIIIDVIDQMNVDNSLSDNSPVSILDACWPSTQHLSASRMLRGGRQHRHQRRKERSRPSCCVCMTSWHTLVNGIMLWKLW